jgi:ATP-dependent exoDNAse (exonuclease V) alpha subunit
MDLTSGQQAALKAIQEVHQSHPEGGGIVIVSGYAGTGKTTLLKTLAEDEKLTVVAPTGKAALRASEVAPVSALTVHRWLYEVAEDPKTGKLVTALKTQVEVPENKTLFVDEASMVTFRMFKDLYETCKVNKMNIVFIGDGFQLPPVEFDEKYRGFSVLASDTPAHYRVNLTEVVRQALDSPIIRASMQVRDMRSDLQALSDLPIVRSSDLAKTGARIFENDGATICHKNTTRHELNNKIREELGITGEKVKKGEPLMVLLNNYELDVYNGEIVTVLDEPKLLGDKPVVVTDRFVNESLNMWYYGTRIETPLGAKRVLFADREVFGSSGKIGTKSIRRSGMDLSRSLKIADLRAEGVAISYSELEQLKGNEVVNCNLGYAMTAHRAQGSEFPHVLVVIENSIRLHSQEGRRWLYTAISRARKVVKLCWL